MITQLKRHIKTSRNIIEEIRVILLKVKNLKEVNIVYNLLNNNNGNYNFTEGDAFNFSNINLPHLFSSVKDKFFVLKHLSYLPSFLMKKDKT